MNTKVKERIVAVVVIVLLTIAMTVSAGHTINVYSNKYTDSHQFKKAQNNETQAHNLL